MGRRLIDLTGDRFGRLVVIERADNDRKIFRNPDGSVRRITNYPRWKCKCDCGKIVTVYGHHLRAGLTKSCGCYRADSVRARFKKGEKTTE